MRYGWNKLYSILRKEQRSDAKFASLARAFKKIPLYLLEECGSKWNYKAQDIFDVVREYLKVFSWWVWVLYKVDDNTLKLYTKTIHDLFLNFIVLSYPDSRWNEILDLLVINRDNILNKDSYNILKSVLTIRTKASKKSYRMLKSLNWCYRLFWDRTERFIIKMIPSLKKQMRILKEMK